MMSRHSRAISSALSCCLSNIWSKPGQGVFAAGALVLLPDAAIAQPVATPVVTPVGMPVAARVTAEQSMAQTRRFTRTATSEDCAAEQASTSDIIVCGARQPRGLPIRPGDQDVQPDLESDRLARRACGGMPCAGNVLATVAITTGLIGLLLDPEADLGDAERIPARFRGANR